MANASLRVWQIALSIALLASSSRSSAAWESHGPPGGRLVSVAFDGDVGTRAYAGTADRGAYRSDDGGLSWTRLPTPHDLIELVAVEPSAPHAFLVASSTAGLSGRTLSRSLDHGATYTTIFEFGDAMVDLAFDPKTPGRYYLATSNGGLYRTDDTGAHFTSGSFCALISADPVLYDVDVDQASRVWAIVDGTVQRSADACATFSVVRGDPDTIGTARAIAIDPSRSGVAFLGTTTELLQTLDDGVTWTSRGSFGEVSKIVVAPSGSPRSVVAATESGLIRSLDGGLTWTKPSGLGVGSTTTVAIDPKEATRWLAGKTIGGAFSSNDGGARFVGPGAGIASVTNDVAVLSSGEVIAATLGGGTFRSTDFGATWTAFDANLDGTPDLVSIASTTPPIATTRTLPLIRRETDGWKAFGEGLPSVSGRVLAVSAAAPSDMLIGLTGKGVFRSIDGGLHWSSVSSIDVTHDAQAIAFDPSDPKHALVAVTNVGIYESRDTGETFALLSPVVTPSSATGYVSFVRAIAVDPLDTARVVLGSQGAGILVSSDSVATLNEITTPTSIWTYALAFSRRGVVYAGSAGSDPIAAFRSTDRGTTWKAFADGFPHSSVSAIRIDESTSHVYAATESDGVLVVHDESVSTSDAGLDAMPDAPVDGTMDATPDAMGDGSIADARTGSDASDAGDAGEGAIVPSGCGCRVMVRTPFDDRVVLLLSSMALTLALVMRRRRSADSFGQRGAASART